MTSAEVARLLQARPAGPGKFIARCPGHRDRSPSLSIREAEDGRTLIHCHAGCQPERVLAAVGLDYSDLWPENHHHRRIARRLAHTVHHGPRDEVDPVKRAELALRDHADKRGREIENLILLRNKKMTQAEKILDRDRDKESGWRLLEEALVGMAELEWLADLYRSHDPKSWMAARNWEAANNR